MKTRALRGVGGALVLGGAALLLAGCPHESDYVPPIAVSPGVSGRMGLIQRRSGQDDKPAPGAKASPARAHVMNKGQELGGTNAIGRAGDIVLENDEVVFVIDRIGAGAGFAESGGNLVDAADAKTRKDELGQMFSFFGLFPRQAVYEQLTFRDEQDGGALVEVKGKELYDPSLEVTTTYHLAAGDRAILVRTAIVNRGKTASALEGLGDAVQWGMTEKIAPGKERSFKGPAEGTFVGGLGIETSYALTSTDGHVMSLSGATWTDTFQEKNVTIAAGGQVAYERVFLVGARGDRSSLLAELVKTSGGDVGTLSVKLRGPKGEIPAPLGARVSLRTADDHEVLDIVGQGRATVIGEVPPGNYLVTYGGGVGRTARGAKVPVVVAKGKTSEVTIDVSEPGDLAFVCEDPAKASVPCKATVLGVAPTDTPNFGPRHRSGPAKNRITSETGHGEVRLAPGTYDIVLSRGPEYSIARARAVVKEGETTRVEGVLERVVDTTGFLAADLHQHSMLGADAPVGKRDRVIANAAEGVEIAMTTEHNIVADLSGIVRDLALGDVLVHVPGDEVTTDAQKLPFGHLNVFPLVEDLTKPRGGAFAIRGKLAKDVVAEARALPFPVVVQVNHPRSGRTGYFDALKLDRKTGVGTGDGYTTDFDTLEVWNGRDVQQREKVIDDYLSLLAAGRPVTPTASTDTHGVVGEEPGYPRTMIRSPRDKDLGAWDAARTQEIVKELRAGRSTVLTNAPFLRVSIDGKGPGDVVRAPRGSKTQVRVHVEAAAWVDVTHVGFMLAKGGPSRKDGQAKREHEPVETALATLKDARGKPVYACDGKVCKGDLVLTTTVTEDDAIVVYARGMRELTEVLDGASDELRPFALTSAIFLDADGDGKSLGR